MVNQGKTDGGGGIRGLSELYVLRELMTSVSRIERDLDPEADSSAASPLFRLRDKGGKESPQSYPEAKGGPYLPCHYFDYIGGISTGGYDFVIISIVTFKALLKPRPGS